MRRPLMNLDEVACADVEDKGVYTSRRMFRAEATVEDHDREKGGAGAP